MDVLSRLYPEKNIAGFCRNDHRIVFFNQINALLRPDMSVLDFGAGRGKWADVEKGYRLTLTTLRGKCREVIGADVDDAVTSNSLVDRAVVLNPAERLPFGDAAFDLILSWAVFEHIDDPAFMAAELTRVLKPGGWICAVTPGKWSYFAIGARLLPNRYHAWFVTDVLKSGRKDADVFPTEYRLNTLSAIGRYFPAPAFESFSYYHNGPPAYHGGRFILAYLWKLWMWLMPPVFSQQIHVFLQKRSDSK
jgi:SAM-dependent methyltransferase